MGRGKAETPSGTTAWGIFFCWYYTSSLHVCLLICVQHANSVSLKNFNKDERIASVDHHCTDGGKNNSKLKPHAFHNLFKIILLVPFGCGWTEFTRHVVVAVEACLLKSARFDKKFNGLDQHKKIISMNDNYYVNAGVLGHLFLQQAHRFNQNLPLQIPFNSGDNEANKDVGGSAWKTKMTQVASEKKDSSWGAGSSGVKTMMQDGEGQTMILEVVQLHGGNAGATKTDESKLKKILQFGNQIFGNDFFLLTATRKSKLVKGVKQKPFIHHLFSQRNTTWMIDRKNDPLQWWFGASAIWDGLGYDFLISFLLLHLQPGTGFTRVCPDYILGNFYRELKHAPLGLILSDQQLACGPPHNGYFDTKHHGSNIKITILNSISLSSNLIPYPAVLGGWFGVGHCGFIEITMCRNTSLDNGSAKVFGSVFCAVVVVLWILVSLMENGDTFGISFTLTLRCKGTLFLTANSDDENGRVVGIAGRSSALMCSSLPLSCQHFGLVDAKHCGPTVKITISGWKIPPQMVLPWVNGCKFFEFVVNDFGKRSEVLLVASFSDDVLGIIDMYIFFLAVSRVLEMQGFTCIAGGAICDVPFIFRSITPNVRGLPKRLRQFGSNFQISSFPMSHMVGLFLDITYILVTTAGWLGSGGLPSSLYVKSTFLVHNCFLFSFLFPMSEIPKGCKESLSSQEVLTELIGYLFLPKDRDYRTMHGAWHKMRLHHYHMAYTRHRTNERLPRTHACITPWPYRASKGGPLIYRCSGPANAGPRVQPQPLTGMGGDPVYDWTSPRTGVVEDGFNNYITFCVKHVIVRHCPQVPTVAPG
ncbi:hypothetical protein OSB04_007794 [Centaurea solstitialis]|uniref:Uncharacterized protein n=1 Tax=Centaurea solstitialis TaxID=347529 RepID=A0AA38TKK3_9ASTR|nr:hypothetical protein OSB04_007794 [Centaurea solstitialis]